MQAAERCPENTGKWYDDQSVKAEIEKDGTSCTFECKTGYNGKKDNNDVVTRDPFDTGGPDSPYYCECDPSKALCNPLDSSTLSDFFNNLLSTAAVAAGSLVIAIIVFGGIMFITAGDSPDKQNRAKKIIIYALIGFIVVLIAATLVSVIRVIT